MTGNMADSLGLASAIIILLGEIIYFYFVVKGDSVPNPSSWLVWMPLGTIGCITYHEVAAGKPVWYVTVVNMSCMLITFLYCWRYGKFGPLQLPEKIALCLVGLLGCFWATTGDQFWTNVFVQGITVISYAPTIRGLWKREITEHGFPWVIFFSAYAVASLSVVIDANAHAWQPFTGWIFELVHPLMLTLLVGIVTVVTLVVNAKVRSEKASARVVPIPTY